MTESESGRNARRSALLKTEERLSYQLARAEHAVRLEIERALRDEGIGLIAWAILNWLCREPGLSVTELSARVFVSQQAVSKVVAALGRDGLLERRPRVGKARIHDLKATAKGLKVSIACDVHILRIEDRLRQQLLSRNIDMLGEVLNVICTTFSSKD